MAGVEDNGEGKGDDKKEPTRGALEGKVAVFLLPDGDKVHSIRGYFIQPVVAKGIEPGPALSSGGIHEVLEL